MALDAPSFRDALLALPPALCLHVVEEWPGFPRWARRFASPRYSDRAYLVTHAIAIGGAVALTALLRSFAPRWLVFAFFALWLLPGVLWNALFHVGASALSRSYCPGAVTGAFVHLPLALGLAALALREGLISACALAHALAIGALFHVLEVGHNVFERW